jgi:GNAT superfamily N-acetyltransferase
MTGRVVPADLPAVNLRLGREVDADALLEIQRTASLAALKHIFDPALYPFPDQEIRRSWQQRLGSDDLQVLVAERRGHPVGSVAWGQGRLEGFFVLPIEWGHGVANALHAEAVVSLRRGRASQCQLWALQRNFRARRFYERRGWQLDGRHRDAPFPPYPPEVGYTLQLS